MHKVVVEIVRVHIISSARGAQVAFFKEVNFHVVCQRDPDSNIELTLLDQQRPLNILLNYESLGTDRRFLVTGCVTASRLCLRFHGHDHCGGGFSGRGVGLGLRGACIIVGRRIHRFNTSCVLHEHFLGICW